jgi:hypothetical protein
MNQQLMEPVQALHVQELVLELVAVQQSLESGVAMEIGE